MNHQLERHLGIKVANRYRYSSQITGTASEFIKYGRRFLPEGVDWQYSNPLHQHGKRLLLAARNRAPDQMCSVVISHPETKVLMRLVAESDLEAEAAG